MAIQEVYRGGDDWLYVKRGPVSSLYEDLPAARDEATNWTTKHYDFKVTSEPHLDFQWLRTPEPDRIFLISSGNGGLTLIGREWIGSWYEQALVARR